MASAKPPSVTKKSPSSRASLANAEKTIASWAAAYPEVVEEAPWGHRAFKVRGKTFMFLTLEDAVLGFSLKLPLSGFEVLGLPFAEPTGYGLGKSGWVSFSFEADADVPLELIEQWLRESFVAIAPKKVSQVLTRSAEGVDDDETAPSKANVMRRGATPRANPARATAKKTAKQATQRAPRRKTADKKTSSKR